MHLSGSRTSAFLEQPGGEVEEGVAVKVKVFPENVPDVAVKDAIDAIERGRRKHEKAIFQQAFADLDLLSEMAANEFEAQIQRQVSNVLSVQRLPLANGDLNLTGLAFVRRRTFRGGAVPGQA